MTNIPIDKIKPNPQQPRHHFDQVELLELADSIKANGLLQPILVEDHGDQYILVAGERRLRAHQLLGLETIEANIIPPTNHNGQQLLISAIVENIQRQDINPIEEARAYRRLQIEYKLTMKRIGRLVGKNSGRVAQILVLVAYDKEIQDKIEFEKFPITPALAWAIQRIPDKNARLQLAEAVSEKNMSVKAAVKAADEISRTLDSAKRMRKCKSPALELARRKNNLDELNEEHAPSRWNIFRKTGILPEWPLIPGSAYETCEACLLKPVASEESCSDCPLAEFLIRLVEAAQ